MPKNETAIAALIVVCITILCALFLVRDSLCELQYQSNDMSLLAHFVVYEAVR